MQEHSFTLYAQWSADRHSWMIVDDEDFHPVVEAESPEQLVAAYGRRLEEERRPLPSA